MASDPVRLATRGSRLAIAQARSVADALDGPGTAVELVERSTTGDELDEALIHELGTTGAFVRDLDRSVLDHDVDAAVHSMKDVPTEQPAELVLAAVRARGAAHDVLVSPAGHELSELPAGARVGTASLRRQAQLLRARPDLEVVAIRGNVDTRLAKLYVSHPDEDVPAGLVDAVADVDPPDPSYDALVLAAAGLERAGLAGAVATTRLEESVPAPGQGTIAVTSRDDDLGEWLNDRLDDPKTRVETTVERRILATLGGGCVAPIGIHAVVQGEQVHTRVQVLDRTGEQTIQTTRQLDIATHLEAAEDLAAELLDRGAGELIEQAKRDVDRP